MDRIADGGVSPRKSAYLGHLLGAGTVSGEE